MFIEKSTDVWEYDGSYYGFLTLVYQAFTQQRFPEIILTPETSVESLFPSIWIKTDKILADKISVRLIKRLRKENMQFIIDGFYCSLKEKEVCLLEAIKIGIKTTDLFNNHLGHPAILALQKSIKALYNEAHLFTGFVRFEYVDNFLYSTIAPKHFSLPYICPHFAQRYSKETILIYDETHRLLALIIQGKISFIEDTDPPAIDFQETEKTIQENWRIFLQAVTISERKNERVQLSHLPKRFRGHMVDFDV